MNDRFSCNVVHTGRSPTFYDGTLGALRYKRLAWWL